MTLRTSILFICLMTFSHCEAQQNYSEASEKTTYTFKNPSSDGTGKYYLGREISHVMGHLAAGWLERPEREREEGVSKAIENLKLESDAYLADIGAGSGYYTFRLAQKVPDGKVFAVDLQPEMLQIIRQKVKQNKIENIELIKGEETSPNLAKNSIDLALMVDVYHELSYPKEMMQEIVQALKPGGRFVLLEYRMEDPKVPIKQLHKMSLDQAVKEMKAVGLQLKENKSNLPWQHFMIFVKQ